MSSSLRRKPVNKAKSAKAFRAKAAKTKSANVGAGPMRGGYRL